jgi:hypothetical protein
MIGDRCYAPKDDRELIIIGFLGNVGDPNFEAQLVPATGPTGPARWCQTRLLREVT